MPTYDYRCAEGHVTEFSRPMADREDPASCPRCGGVAGVIFSPPSLITIPRSFQSKHGCLTWSDFHDRTEKELARDPTVERASVAASRPGVGNTISQPGPELKRRVKASGQQFASNSV